LFCGVKRSDEELFSRLESAVNIIVLEKIWLD
jgi:hypothetical protein